MINISKLFIYSNIYYNLSKLGTALNEVDAVYEAIRFINGLADINKEDIPGWIDLNKDILDKYNLESADVFKGSSLEFVNIPNKSDSKRMLFINSDLKKIKSKVNILDEYLIKGYKSIKNLYGLTISYKGYINSTDYDKNDNDRQILYSEVIYKNNYWRMSSFSAHNELLFYAMNDFLYGGKYPYLTQKELDDFFVQNKARIAKATNLGSGPENIKVLGTGAAKTGIAIDIGNDKVLKISSIKYEYDMALEAMKRLHSNPALHDKPTETMIRLHSNPSLADTEAMIYDTGILGDIRIGSETVTFYYYVIEKMIPLFTNDKKDPNRQRLNDVFRAMINDLRIYLSKRFPLENDESFLKLRELLDKPKSNKILIEKIKSFAEKYISNNSDILSHAAVITNIFKDHLNEDWLIKFVEEVMVKHLTGRGDLHIGNIGINSQGYLRYFDPSYESHQDRIHTGYIEKD